MSFLVPLAALALLAIPAIVLLYFLKVRRPEIRVATLMFWRPYVADRQANAPWQRPRYSLLLLLQLLAALLLALGLMRPGLIGAAGVDTTTVAIIDASPSMAATDAQPSRFGAAVEKVRNMAGQMRPGQQMAVILAGPHASLLVQPTGDSAQVDAALDRARPAGQPGDFGEAISLAGSLVQGRPGAAVTLISDGHLKPPATPPRVSAQFSYIGVGSTGENAGIETVSRSGRGSLVVRVANYGRTTRDLKVEMRADGRLIDVLPVRLEGNTTTDLTWNRLPQGAQVASAHLTPGDAFASDDDAWLVTAQPNQHTALLVTAQNGYMDRALRLRPGLQVTTIKPADYKEGRYDLYVFDGWLPPGPLPEPALLINPPAGQGPVPMGAAMDPGAVQPGNPREPLLRDISLTDVHVQSAGQVKAPDQWRPIVSGAAGPLVLVRDGQPPGAMFTFDLHHSDIVLRSAFPILVQNLLNYLLPGGFENQSFQPDQPVQLQAEPDAKSMDVTAPDGRKFHLSPPFAPFTDTSALGVYTVRQSLTQGGTTSRFVVQLQDPSVSRIAPGAAPIVEEAQGVAGNIPHGTFELWWLLVVAAVGLLAVEWILYLRGRLTR